MLVLPRLTRILAVPILLCPLLAPSAVIGAPMVHKAAPPCSASDVSQLRDELRKITDTLDSMAQHCPHANALKQLADRARECPNARLELGAALHALVNCHTVEGQPDASCRAYQEAIAVLRKIPGGHAPLVGALADLAGYELSIGRCRAAERHAKESLQILRKYEVQEPKTRLKARIAVAAVYMEKGRITAAAELYREILKEANAASVHSQLEPLVVVAMLNMADQLLVSNPKATRDILDPLLMQLATAGPEYEPFLILARVVEAHWYHATGNKTKAAALASEALHHAEAVFPPNDLVLAQFRLIAAEIFLAAENHGEAERQVSAAIRTWDMYRANSQHLLAALVCHSTALRKLGRPKEAAATEDRIARLSHSMEAIERENTVDISILRAGQGGLP